MEDKKMRIELNPEQFKDLEDIANQCRPIYEKKQSISVLFHGMNVVVGLARYINLEKKKLLEIVTAFIETNYEVEN